MSSQRLLDCISILVVDSNPAYRESLNAELSFAGFFNVITAPNNNVARHILARVECNIALIEFETDNRELLTLLATDRHARTLVGATTYARSVSARCKETPKGIDIFVPKPTSRRDLVNAIATLLSTPIGWRGKIVLLPSALRRPHSKRSLAAPTESTSQKSALRIDDEEVLGAPSK